MQSRGLPRWDESACWSGDAGDLGLIPGSGRSPGGRNGNPFQYSCQENPLDREAWQITVHGFANWATFTLYIYMLPWWLSVKESVFNAGDTGLIPGSGRSPGEGNGYALQYSCLGNPMYRGAWWATVHGVAKSWTQLSDWTQILVIISLW